MTDDRSIKFQINTLPEIKARAKAVAYDRNLSLTEFVLLSLAKEGDKELKRLIEKDLKGRTKPGRPTSK